MSKPVLVVEDDADIREALVGILRDEGFVADGVGNGAEALARLRAHADHHPALILLDLMMPVMNGWQFRAEQQHDEALKAIPVVVISADAGVKQKAESLAVSGYLKKPIELDQLLEIVARYCGAAA